MMGTFAPSDSALLLIDHQVGTMKLIKNIPLEVVRTRGSGPDGHEHADGRTGAGLEPPGRGPIARYPVPRRVAKHRLTRRSVKERLAR